MLRKIVNSIPGWNTLRITTLTSPVIWSVTRVQGDWLFALGYYRCDAFRRKSFARYWFFSYWRVEPPMSLARGVERPCKTKETNSPNTIKSLIMVLPVSWRRCSTFPFAWPKRHERNKIMNHLFWFFASTALDKALSPWDLTKMTTGLFTWSC